MICFVFFFLFFLSLIYMFSRWTKSSRSNSVDNSLVTVAMAVGVMNESGEMC